jgi:acetyl esterase/lipase
MQPRLLLGTLVALMVLFGITTAAQAKEPPPIKGVSYGPSPAELQTIYPAKEAGATTVIFVHGGGWRFQKLETEQGSDALGLQKEGFAVFNVNYPQDSPMELAFPLEPDAIETATSWAISHGESYNASPHNVVLLGGSAGGQLVAMAAEQLDAAVPGTVKAVITLSGPTNLKSLVELGQRHEIKTSLIHSLEQALGCGPSLTGCSEAFETEWSPTAHVPEVTACPAWLLFSAEADLVPITQADEMLAALEGAGCSAKLDVVAGKGHSFSYWPTVAKADIYPFIKSE